LTTTFQLNCVTICGFVMRLIEEGLRGIDRHAEGEQQGVPL
jgi:hypothetical protein